MLRFLTKLVAKPSPSARRRKPRLASLALERLEDRLAPVVGANATAPVVAAGTGFGG